MGLKWFRRRVVCARTTANQKHKKLNDSVIVKYQSISILAAERRVLTTSHSKPFNQKSSNENWKLSILLSRFRKSEVHKERQVKRTAYSHVQLKQIYMQHQ